LSEKLLAVIRPSVYLNKMSVTVCQIIQFASLDK